MNYQALENKALDDIDIECELANVPNVARKMIKLRTKSHLQLAYQRGVDKTIERFATGEFIRGKEAEKFRQQAIAEEREKIVKILRGFPLSDKNGVEFVFNEENWKAGYAALDAVADYLENKDKNDKDKSKLQELQNK